MKTRESWADFAKGIGILLVVLGHIKYTYEPLKIWLYTFHMPLFFFITGYFTHKRSTFRNDVKHKAYILLVPYLILTILEYSLEDFLNIMTTKEVPSSDLKHLLGILLQFPPHSIYETQFWFFSCLFLMSIILLILIYNFKENENKVILFTTILSLVGLVLIKLIKIKLIWNFDISLIMLFFAGIGYYIKNKKILEKFNSINIKYKILCISIFATIGMLFTYINSKAFNVRIDYYMRDINAPFSCYIAGISNIIFIILLSNIIATYKIKIGKYSILEYFGKNSAIYYVLTAWGIHVGYYFITILNKNCVTNSITNLIITLIITILVSTPFINLLSETFPKLFMKYGKMRQKENG